MKLSTSLVFLLILIFHVLVSVWYFYDSFLVDYDGWTYHMWKPFASLLFTTAWFFSYRKKYIWGFVYIGFVMAEFLFFAVYRDEIWAATFGKVLFPIDLIFVAALLLLFKKHFGILQGPNKLPNRAKGDA